MPVLPAGHKLLQEALRCPPPAANKALSSYPSPAGAKLVLKSGEKPPCITLHYLPSLQPVQTLAGPAALGQLRHLLQEQAATAPPPAPAPEATGTGPGSLVVLRKGAAQAKEVLAAGRASASPVLVVWTRSGAGSEQQAALRAAAAEAAAAARGLTLVDADAGASNANSVLAGALKVASFPEVHVYRDMKLESKLSGAGATPAALAALVARLEAPGSGSTGSTGGPSGSNGSGEGMPAASNLSAPTAGAASSAAKAAAGASSGSGAGSVFDPPGGKFAKPGATKRFPDSRLGYFFPKMPCLRWGPGRCASPLLQPPCDARLAVERGCTASASDTRYWPCLPAGARQHLIHAVLQASAARHLLPPPTYPPTHTRLCAAALPPAPPCRCGCPWWSSEEWDARCMRCGWDCESSGYDDDSQPLPKHRARWEQFTAAIRDGCTPAWAPRPGSGTAPPRR